MLILLLGDEIAGRLVGVDDRWRGRRCTARPSRCGGSKHKMSARTSATRVVAIADASHTQTQLVQIRIPPVLVDLGLEIFVVESLLRKNPGRD